MFCNVNLSSFENVLQKDIRTGRVRLCSFRASEGTDFENFCLPVNHGAAIMGSMYVLVCQKKPRIHCWKVTLPKYYQNEIWSNTCVLYEKHF